MSARFQEIRDKTITALSRFFAEGHLTHAAALAFYGLFSVPALLIVALRIAAIVFDEQQAQTTVLQAAQSWMGPESLAFVSANLEHLVGTQNFGGTLVVGIAVLLISGSSVFSTMQSILNKIFETHAPPDESHFALTFVRRRLFSMSLVLAFGALLIISLGIETVFSVMTGWMERRLPGSSERLPHFSSQLLTLPPVAIAIVLIYRILPDTEIPWRHCILGSLITTGLFILFRTPIRIYLSNTHPENIYHAAGSVLMVIMWMFLVSAVFLLGAVITHELIRPKPTPSGQRTDAGL